MDKIHTQLLNDYIILTGRSNPSLAQKIGKILKKEVHEPISIFSDGEIRVRIDPNLRRRHIFIIQSTSSPVNDYLMELIFLIDAAKRASAAEITVVLPYYGYSRQDRKEMPRVPISSSVIAKILEGSGADKIVTVDIHSEQQEGFVKIPWDNVYGSYALIPVLKKQFKNLIIASPDKGGMVRATGYARLLKAQGVALVYKDRDLTVNNKSEALAMIGDVKGKEVLLVDDMLDTGGTLVHAADFIKKNGAKSVSAAITHGIFSGSAVEKINNSALDVVFITDTIQQKEDILKNKKIKIVSVAPLLADVIKKIESGKSISSLIL